MGKATKLALRYRNGRLPEGFSELLGNADEADCRLLIAVMMLADSESGVAPVGELATLLEMSQAEVDASLKFWRGAGVLGVVRGTESKRSGESTEKRKNEETTEKPREEAARETEKPRVATAHREGAVERTATLGGYTTAELASLMEQRRVSAQFIDEAQRVMGKIFRTYDIGILVGIVDQLGFEEEAVLTLLTYAAGRGKKTLRYVEQMAMGLYDDGITETGAVVDRISRLERSGEVVGRIKQLFGIGARELTTTEKRLFTAWTEKFAYDVDVIRMAYDITVDTIQKPAPKYTNSILEKWYAEGLRTAEDVRAYVERDASERSRGTVEKSYDVEDFFEAALQRSYDELK